MAGAQVTNGIFIGSLQTAMSKEFLSANNIGAIVNLSCLQYIAPIPVYYIDIADEHIVPDTLAHYLQSFANGIKAIRAARKRGKNVLIHCMAGINRSATLIGLYLIECGWTYDQLYAALSTANAARETALLTNGSFVFLLQLRSAFKNIYDVNLAS